MAGNGHWQEALDEIEEFRAKIKALSADGRSTEALTEIACQLIWLNAHISELNRATHRVADNT